MRRVSAIPVLLCLGCNVPSGGRSDTASMSTSVEETDGPATGTTTPTTGTISASGTSGTSGVVVTGTGSSEASITGSETSVGSSTGEAPSFDLGGFPDMPVAPPLPLPQLWYSVEDLLVYLELDPADGSVAQVISTFANDPTIDGTVNSCSLTMLGDGSLLGGRGIDGQTRLFHVPQPPTVASEVDVVVLGDMPDGIYIEALYTDCDGRVYLMDTGLDSVSNTGNRLLRFTGDYLAGDLAYEVITDLMVAVSADIDDMSPGFDDQGAVIDNPGFGIDSGAVYRLDYTTGTGALLGMAGTYGIHALGGPLFTDEVSRLYVLTVDAEVYAVDPATLTLSPLLTTGPTLASGGPPGDAGFAGPLTDCRTGFPQG